MRPPRGPAPKKRFGQHFLHDPAVIGRIVAAIGPRPGEVLVEIGPGTGALTQALLPASDTLHAVEIDRDLIASLQARFGAAGLVLYRADALDFDFCRLAEQGRPLRLAGNLPYNISTPLLFHLLEHIGCIRDMHFMVQKEVADRLCAAPGSKTYGRLSVMVQWRCRVTRLFTVGPGAFTPPPKVDSALIRLQPHETPPAKVSDPQAFARIVRAAFGQRRKALRNSLRELLDDSVFHGCGIDPRRRAETLTVEEFACLSNASIPREKP